MNEQRRFSNALRILRNIDGEELPFLNGDQIHRFLRDPYDFYIRADDPTEDKLWALIEARQPKRVMEDDGRDAVAYRRIRQPKQEGDSERL